MLCIPHVCTRNGIYDFLFVGGHVYVLEKSGFVFCFCFCIFCRIFFASTIDTNLSTIMRMIWTCYDLPVLLSFPLFPPFPDLPLPHMHPSSFTMYIDVRGTPYINVQHTEYIVHRTSYLDPVPRKVE